MESNSRAPALEVIRVRNNMSKLRLETLQQVVCPDFWGKSVPEHRPGDSECTASEVRLDAWNLEIVAYCRAKSRMSSVFGVWSAELTQIIRSHAMEGLEN